MEDMMDTKTKSANPFDAQDLGSGRDLSDAELSQVAGGALYWGNPNGVRELVGYGKVNAPGSYKRDHYQPKIAKPRNSWLGWSRW
jgi:hypothetical protein